MNEEPALDELATAESRACKGRPHAELIAEIMDSRIPKNEREHAACAEIERQRGECLVLADIIRDCDAVLATIEPENDDEAERLSDLRRQIAYALAPYSKPSEAQQFGGDLWGGAIP